MTRNEFLTALRGRLSALPKEEQDAALKYYEEYFDEAESEEEATRQLGSPDSIAEKILADYAPPPAAMPAPSPAPEAPAKPRHSAWYYVGIVTLCVLASPMLIGLGAAALGIVLAMLVVLLAVLICIVAPFFAVGGASGQRRLCARARLRRGSGLSAGRCDAVRHRASAALAGAALQRLYRLSLLLDRPAV